MSRRVHYAVSAPWGKRPACTGGGMLRGRRFDRMQLTVHPGLVDCRRCLPYCAPQKGTR